MSKNFIIDNSFQLIRTNPKLTSNIKVIFDSDNNIYLESFDSNKQLSDDKYKHFQITKDTYFEDKLPVFYDGLPINLAFDIRYDNDQDIMYNSYNQQYDNLYFSGIKKIEDNKFFEEEFEYLAPLYIRKGNFPTNFIVLRIDGPAVYEEKSIDYDVSDTNKDNFRDEIINKWKCITVFDFDFRTDIGYWVDRNFINNDRFPDAPLEIDFKKSNYPRWYGIDYSTGVYTEKSLYLEDTFYYEQPHFKMESIITNGYQDNELVFPNIVNFKYLFDDNPSTPFESKKYSINRYLGFYTQSLDLVKRVTPYKQPEFIEMFSNGTGSIKNNIFYDENNNNINPFDINWDDNKNYFIYTNDNLYNVIRKLENSVYVYKIIADISVNLSDITNENEIDINFSGNIDSYSVEMVPRDIIEFDIDSYIDSIGLNEMKSDLYLIKIDDNYHIIYSEVQEDGDIKYFIRSDFGIRCDCNSLKYWIINENVEDYVTNVSVEDDVNDDKPLIFDIYKVKFSDIKDFDFDRVNTGYADYEFEKEDEYPKGEFNTPEHKLYTTDFLDDNVNKGFKEYPIGNINELEKVIVSSEYISSDELYQLNKNGLTEIWRKNQSVCKWGYMGSMSHTDYPYKLNNSKKVGSNFNRTTNISLTTPNVMEKTNDYFYRIGDIMDKSGLEIEHYRIQTLSIETETYKEDSKKFNLDTYIESNVDYFDYFFKNTKINELGGIEQKTKYSLVVNGTKYNPSNTLFQGIKYNIRGLKGIVRNSEKYIETIIIDKSKIYNNYKFSVIINTDDITDNKGILENGDNINIFLNDKYKNVLIIINAKYTGDIETNDPIETVYNDNNINTKLHTAYNFMNAINNLNDESGYNQYITYNYIDSDGILGRTSSVSPVGITGGTYSLLNTSWGKEYPPYTIDVEAPDQVITKRHSFNKAAIKGPKYNIYDKYKKDFFEIPYDRSFIKEPLSRMMDINETPVKYQPRRFNETQEYENVVYRFSGPYEPIFKDIELFKNSEYDVFNTNNFNITKGGGKVTQITSDPDDATWRVRNKVLDECNNDYCQSNIEGSGPSEFLSSSLIVSDFGFNIPLDSTIGDIEITVKKKCDKDIIFGFIVDNVIQLTTDNTLSGLTGNNMAIGSGMTTSYDSGLTWKVSPSSVTYTTNISSLTSEIVNDDKFGLVIQAAMYNDKSSFITNAAYVDCVHVDISYTVNDIETGKTYFVNLERNYTFDTTLENFGMIDELQYSKVNEKEIILKIKNQEEDRSIYPMVDEFGYSYDKRFIFKSSWDSDFYLRTKNIILNKNER